MFNKDQNMMIACTFAIHVGNKPSQRRNLNSIKMQNIKVLDLNAMNVIKRHNQKVISVNTNELFMKGLNTVAHNATIRQLQWEILINTKGQFMRG